MKVLRFLFDSYSIYIQVFRLYIIGSLAITFFSTEATVFGVDATANGFYLAIFSLEFYCILLITYNLRPSRFRRVILKSYTERPAPPFKKQRFFWTVYIITLLIIFGVPLLLCFGYIMEVWRLMDRANTFIIAHVGAWIPALLFLLVNILRSQSDIERLLDHARFSISRLIYVLFIAGVTSVVLYLLLYLRQTKHEPILVACFAFNAALLWTDIKFFFKTRSHNKKSPYATL